MGDLDVQSLGLVFRFKKVLLTSLARCNHFAQKVARYRPNRSNMTFTANIHTIDFPFSYFSSEQGISHVL